MRDNSAAVARLDARNLTAERGEAVLFDALTLAVEPGTLLHVRGANGSGKTTLLRTLAGLAAPDSGTVTWRGVPVTGPAAYASELVYVGHRHGLCAELDAVENLEFLSAATPARPRTDVLGALAALDAGALARRRVRHLSAGQRQRVALARLALFEAPLWMLDEPFTALDADGRALVEALIERHLERGGLALLATHQAFRVRGDVRDLVLGASA